MASSAALSAAAFLAALVAFLRASADFSAAFFAASEALLAATVLALAVYRSVATVVAAACAEARAAAAASITACTGGTTNFAAAFNVGISYYNQYTVLDDQFVLEFIRPSTFVQNSILFPEEITDKPQELSVFNVGYNITELEGDSELYRYGGGYVPSFREILKFDNVKNAVQGTFDHGFFGHLLKIPLARLNDCQRQ